MSSALLCSPMEGHQCRESDGDLTRMVVVISSLLFTRPGGRYV